MLEIFGKAIISFIEKELVEAAPEIEKLLLEQLGNLVDMISEFLGAKVEGLAKQPDDAPALENKE